VGFGVEVVGDKVVEGCMIGVFVGAGCFDDKPLALP